MLYTRVAPSYSESAADFLGDNDAAEVADTSYDPCCGTMIYKGRRIILHLYRYHYPCILL